MVEIFCTLNARSERCIDTLVIHIVQFDSSGCVVFHRDTFEVQFVEEPFVRVVLHEVGIAGLDGGHFLNLNPQGSAVYMCSDELLDMCAVQFGRGYLCFVKVEGNAEGVVAAIAVNGTNEGDVIRITIRQHVDERHLVLCYIAVEDNITGRPFSTDNTVCCHHG